jgi:NADP-dependent 3-hydroxy acid dehydrogenase YdfG
MSGLTVLIVGATSGVGKATARQLADDGHRVLAIGRDHQRARNLGVHLRRRRGAGEAFSVRDKH